MDFITQPTESALKDWRFGSPQAERLCATLLHSEGFNRIEPQCPLGGPDGLKDVLFILNGWRYVAAVYFPTTEKQFKDVRTKFESDLKGVAQNSADGIAFLTNQRLTPSEKEELEALAEASSAKPLIYHIEGIRTILDSPRGYGMRLEFLRIPMKPEEQVSFISQFSSDLSSALGRQASLISDMAAKIADIHSAVTGGETPIFPEPPLSLAATMATRATPLEALERSDKEFVRQRAKFITEHLDLSLLCYLHRTAMEEPQLHAHAGELRRVGVWIGDPGSTPESARFVPPPPEEVASLVDKLLSTWREGYQRTLDGDESTKVKAITAFHHEFLRIHPFLDGNGRVARMLLEQQARELLDIERRIILSDSHAYFQALQEAHSGDLTQLTKILRQAMLGEW
jgi:fido (protein-threonine AMPylation protein)